MSHYSFPSLFFVIYAFGDIPVATAISAQNITVNSFEMVPVEGGTFWMGAQKTSPLGQNYDPNASSNESPVHQVTLDSYYIGRTEVTEALWKAVMGSNPSYFLATCTVTSRAAYNQDNAGLFLGLRLATSDNLLSLNENTEERIQVYPNPTRNSVTVAAEGMSHVAVLSLLGQVVFEADVRGDEAVLDLSQLEAGVYVVRVTTCKGVGIQRVSVF